MLLQVLKLGEPKAGDEAAVSAMAFSPQGSMLVVGHADGDIAFWELRRGGFECTRRSSGHPHLTLPSCPAVQDRPSPIFISHASCGLYQYRMHKLCKHALAESGEVHYS